MRPHRLLPRLFVAADLAQAAEIALEPAQVHHLCNVLRLGDGDRLLAFNGRHGEWLATLRRQGKRAALLEVGPQTRAQAAPADLRLCFAPIRPARLDYAVEKATELGASALLPVITEFAQVPRLRSDRLCAIAVAAAEQCGALGVPEIGEAVRLDDFLAQRDGARPLVFCDEEAELANPLAALRPVAAGPLDILTGPEGGFSPGERQALLAQQNALAISLGPRILRAETAILAALVLVRAAQADW